MDKCAVEHEQRNDKTFNYSCGISLLKYLGEKSHTSA